MVEIIKGATFDWWETNVHGALIVETWYALEKTIMAVTYM